MTTYVMDSRSEAEPLATTPAMNPRRVWNNLFSVTVLGVVASFVVIAVAATALWQSHQISMRAQRSQEEFQATVSALVPTANLLAATLRLHLYSAGLPDTSVRWISRWNALERREQALREQLKAHAIGVPSLTHPLASFQAAHARLHSQQERVFDLVRHGRRVGAVRTLNSAAHEAAVQSYRVALTQLAAAEQRVLAGRVAAAEDRRKSAAVILAGALILLGGAWSVVLAFAARERRRRRNAEDALRAELAEQEQKIAARTLELRRSSTILRHTERQLHDVVSKLPCGILMTDLAGIIRVANHKLEEDFGYPHGALVGRSVDQLVPEDKLSRHVEGFRNLAQLNATSASDDALLMNSVKVFGRRRDQSAFAVELSISRIDTSQGPMFLAAVVDITERQKLQAQLLGAQKLQSVGQLAAGIAHEINTPIQFVGDNIQFLERAFADIAELQQTYTELLAAARTNAVTPNCVAAIDAAMERADWAYLQNEVPVAIRESQEGVKRVANIVRAMKEFSHPGSSRKEQVDLNHLLEITATVARNEWKYVAELAFDLDPTLPPVLCRPSEIGEVILNLLVNAAHAIGEVRRETGTELGRISLCTISDAEFAEIRIADSGGGIPTAARARVFEPFFTTKAVGKGTGQGLAIARSVVVDKHCGTIDFETHEGEGTTFIVRLPLAPSDAESGDETA